MSRYSFPKLTVLVSTVLVLGALLTCPDANAKLLDLSFSGREKDIELGKEYSKIVEAQMGLVTDPERTSKYISALGEKLAQSSVDPDWNFSFKIVDESTPNAFALPGGPIYVSRGLLALSCSEDELAGVIAHEIAHVTHRHASKQKKSGLLHDVLAMPGDVVGGVVSEGLGNVINMPVDTVGGVVHSSYSRSHENEADEYGLQTSARAGYDPSNLADILQRLQRDVELISGEEESFNIFDSHPMTEKRIRRIKSHERDATIGKQNPIATDQADFYAKLDGLWWGVNPASGIWRDQQFLHPDLGVTVHFPKDWITLNTPAQVFAVEPNQEAGIILATVPSTHSPEKLRAEFTRIISEKGGIEPIDHQEQQMGSKTIYVVTYLIKRSRIPVYLHLGWVKIAENTFQITALGDDRQRNALRQSARSLRELTVEERASITGLRLRIARAQANESIAELSARTGNSWSADYTALVNGLDVDSPLMSGQAVKIIRLEQY